MTSSDGVIMLTCSSYFAAEEPVVEHLRKEELINCTCGFMEEDGLMIQVMYCNTSGVVQLKCLL
jgi:hypothetical protein